LQKEAESGKAMQNLANPSLQTEPTDARKEMEVLEMDAIDF